MFFSTSICIHFKRTHNILYVKKEAYIVRIRKPIVCICENKGRISFAVTAQLTSVLVFDTQIVQSLSS